MEILQPVVLQMRYIELNLLKAEKTFKGSI